MGSDSYRNGEDSKDIHGEDRDFRWRSGKSDRVCRMELPDQPETVLPLSPEGIPATVRI